MKEVTEVWKGVPGFENLQASDCGRIAEVKTTVRFDSDNKGIPVMSRNILPQCRERECITVTYGRKKLRVARLVAMAFLPNPKNLPFVGFVNNDRFDVRLNNIRWMSYSEMRERDKYRKLARRNGALPDQKEDLDDLGLTYDLENHDTPLIVPRTSPDQYLIRGSRRCDKAAAEARKAAQASASSRQNTADATSKADTPKSGTPETLLYVLRELSRLRVMAVRSCSESCDGSDPLSECFARAIDMFEATAKKLAETIVVFVDFENGDVPVQKSVTRKSVVSA